MAFAAPKAGMYIYEATAKQTATVIFAHGLGDDTPGWYQAIGAWRRQMPHLAEQVRFVLPLAPRIPITINFGMSMPGWYDIVSPRGPFVRFSLLFLICWEFNGVLLTWIFSGGLGFARRCECATR